MSDAQVPDRRAHGFQRRGTDRWVEATEQCVVPGPPDPSRSKAISEKVELDVRIRSSATPVLAVDDLGLCRMQLQAALCQTRLKFDLESLGFLLASAVNQPVISIPTPRQDRMRPRHPEIECVMQEQVLQDQADNTTLTGASLSLTPRSFLVLHGRPQSSVALDHSP